MIGRKFTPPAGDPAWDAWLVKAKDATDALIAIVQAGGVIDGSLISGPLYKAQKQRLFDAFDGKCAFCEALIQNDQPGDVEHFRPKCGLVGDDDKPVPGHFGYYWLAYDWRNLLPSCADCNRGRYGRDGTYFGKAQYFPVSGPRATRPGDELAEQALLVHPGLDDPAQHLVFDSKTGLIAGTTEKGRRTEKLLGLNREKLPEARKRAYQNAKSTLVHLATACFYDEQDADAAIAELEAHEQGKTPYALAARQAIKDNRPKLAKLARFVA